MVHGRQQVLSGRLAELRRSVDERLPELIPAPETPPERLHRALHHALLGGGKRLRPVLTLAVGELLGAPPEPTLDLGCAVEMVHACSLVLDDLPSMDDAALRRGRPAVHRLFGEETALLAAFALFNRAFATVAASSRRLPLRRHRGEELVLRLTAAVGSDGLIGGQALDLDRAGHAPHEHIDSAKTGALFVLAAELGALAADAPAEEVERVARFARHLGLAYQLADDLQDAAGTPEETGQDAGQDVDKSTLAGVLGAEVARSRTRELLDAATESLVPLGPGARLLHQLAGLVGRSLGV